MSARVGSTLRRGWFAALLVLVALLSGCAFPIVSVTITPDFLAVVPGDSVTVTVTTGPPSCTPPDENPDQPCVDIAGQVFDHVVQNLPAGVTHSIDRSLQSPSTPGVVRITFHVG